MAEEPLHIAGSDINSWHLQLPDVDSAHLMPHCSSPEYIDELCRLIERERIGFVYAQPDMELEVISKYRDRLPARVFMPVHDAIIACHDKMQTNERLKTAGVKVPRSVRVETLDELETLIPKMIKGSDRVWLRAIRGAGSKAALPVQTARHAREWIHYWRSTGRLETSDFMLAEFLPGREFAFQSLWHEGQLVTSQARERLEYVFGNLFPSGQSSSPSVARTVHRDDVNEIATKAVQAADPNPSGVYCVDMKENRAGVPCVTEINIARFFTTSNFFAAAGSNMPYYYLRLAFNEALPDLPRTVPAGLHWIRLMDRGPVLVREEEFRVALQPA
jgi:carbamoyl-phosphate synthase large subunit